MPRSETFASAGLAALAGLHLLWATGSPWPFADRAAFADAVMGHDAFPPPGASVAVAAALGTGAALVGGRPRRSAYVRRAGAAGVVSVLALRGGLGLAGRTDLVARGATSPRFRGLDRRVYAPLCLALAALAAPAARPGARR